MSAYDFRLSLVHHRLDRVIQQEQKSLVPDRWRLMRFKKLRLAIKDRLNNVVAGRSGIPA